MMNGCYGAKPCRRLAVARMTVLAPRAEVRRQSHVLSAERRNRPFRGRANIWMREAPERTVSVRFARCLPNDLSLIIGC
jgi:hypothetical protein